MDENNILKDKQQLDFIENELRYGNTITPNRRKFLMMQKKKLEESMKPVIALDDDDFGALINCAVRYAMGRQTYMPGLIIGFITPLLPYISKMTLYVLKEDYERKKTDEEITGHDMFGDPEIDKPVWDRFYNNVCHELCRRCNDEYC